MRVWTHVPRRLILALSVLALLGGACSSGNDNNSSAAPETEPPSASPGVQAAGTFQLAGNVDHAFQGIGPPVSVSLAGVTLSPEPTESTEPTGPTGPTGTAAAGTPSQQGVMRVTLDNESSELHDKCGVNAGDKVNVFWLTDTQFDTSLITGTTFEASLEGRRVGVAGPIFTTGETQQPDFALPSPTPSPAASAGLLNTNCTLVADRVTVGIEGTALPTVRPRARTRATTRPTTRPTTAPARTTAPPVTTAPPTTAPPTTAPPTATG